MARHRRLRVLQTLETIGVIPVFHHRDQEIALGVVKACVEGGSVVVEWLNRLAGAIDTFKSLENYCKEHLPTAILGVGSVIDGETASMYIQAGANFIVSPCLDNSVAEICNKHKIAYLPGCASVKEIHEAESLGVDICKIFPGEQVGGAEFVKAVLSPRPWSSLMPTGGVEPTIECLSKWFDAGIVCAGIGSKLITPDILANKDFSQLTQKVKDVLEIVKEVRKNDR